ncbi:hypothetical protein Pcinc_024489 [Petrolisthes cinctipes]|uniref:Uncharacterized protein n=1 Tax=Petrolisthes cinctipes TaxID=88211 RepID=A0AAE1KCW7_PETCI|nr:hypothetical protein Pcinc_024489 [Petrolisthes cinctipes]
MLKHEDQENVVDNSPTPTGKMEAIIHDRTAVMEAATTSGSSRILKLFTIAMTTAGYSSCSLLQDIQAVYYCNEYCRIFTVHYCRILKLIFRLYSHVKNTTPVSSKNSDSIVTFYYYMLSFGEEEDIFDITFRLYG